jgi:hypothetical protein
MIEVNPDLLAFLKEEEVRSRNEDLLERAEVALNSYNGELYGDEEDGRSKVVTRDVAEVCDHMGVSVLRVFVSGDKCVEYEPSSEEEEQFADDATERVNMDFQRSGYQLLHDWLKEGNISPLAIVKSSVRMKQKRAEHMIPAMLMHEVEAIEAEDAGIDPETGLEMARVIVMEQEPEFVDELVPLEEYRISPDARHNYIPYEAHAVMKTLSELVGMGFDRDTVEGLTSHESNLTGLSYARDNGLDGYSAERKGALRQVLLLEEYAMFDADNDGIAEQLCVHRVGDTILRIEPCDYSPFIRYCSFPMPGRIAGHSLAEKVTDIQRINTVLNRLGLDGLYTNLAPGYLVHDDSVNENTYDDILTVRPNRVIRWKGHLEPKPENKNDVSAIAWQAMEQMIGQRESRTGITRLNQGLDADALNKTATGMALQSAQGQQMEEYVARNFAEAVACLMRIKLKLLARYGKPMKMRVDGTFRDVDPSQWPEEMNVITRVGLGSGRKEQRLQNRMTVLEIQKECMMAGLPIVGPSEIYKSIAGVIKDASLGSPADFVIDPDSEEFRQAQAAKGPPPPDPEQQKVEAEMQMQAAKMQGEQQIAAMKLEAMREESAAKGQLAHAQAQQQAQLAEAKAEFEAQLAERKFAAEMAMEQQRMQFQAEQSRRDHDRRDFEADAKVSQNRAGGSLDK